MNRLIIRKIDLPLTIKSATIHDSEGDYNVYLNARLSLDEQAKRFRMEVANIKNGKTFSLDCLLKSMETENIVND